MGVLEHFLFRKKNLLKFQAKLVNCFQFGNDVNKFISFGRASVLITVTFPSNVSLFSMLPTF
jgi:hypothetical protein